MGERTMRVLHVVPALADGGMERTLLRLIAQPMEGIEHGVCCLKSADAAMLETCRRLAPTWVVGTGGRMNALIAARRLRGVVDAFGADIVHARSTGVWLDAAMALRSNRRTQLLLSFHGREDLRPPSWRRRLAIGLALARADRVLTVSHESAVAIARENRIAGLRYTVIHNGVDTQRFRPAESEEEVLWIRTRSELPQGPLAICVANLQPIKAIDVLIRAWRQVVCAHPGASLVIVGDGPQRDSIKQMIVQARLADRVRLLGRREDTPDLLRAADLFVLPSRYECCCNAVLEAMASGLPVVACDVGGQSELITPHRTGLLVPPDNPGRLAQAICVLLLEEAVRRRLGQAGRERALHAFNQEQWVERYARLYRSMVAGHAPEIQPVAAEEFACAG